MRLAALSAFFWSFVMLAFAQTANAQANRGQAAKVAVVNVVLGGMTAGIGSSLAGRPFWSGFAKGAVGGAIVLGGKCLIGQERPVTDWLGRGVAAVGTSIVANVSAGHAPLRHVIIPFGPVRVHRDNENGRYRVKLDVVTAAAALSMELKANTSFNARKSLRHGVLVFENSVDWASHELGGTIHLIPEPPQGQVAHELTHVVQFDWVTTAWQAPLERRILRGLPGGETATKYLDLGLLLPLWAVLNETLSSRDRPWEDEARNFALGCG